MVRVQLDNVSIDLPVLGRQALSLKQTIISTATGGALGVKGGVWAGTANEPPKEVAQHSVGVDAASVTMGSRGR